MRENTQLKYTEWRVYVSGGGDDIYIVRGFNFKDAIIKAIQLHHYFLEKENYAYRIFYYEYEEDPTCCTIRVDRYHDKEGPDYNYIWWSSFYRIISSKPATKSEPWKHVTRSSFLEEGWEAGKKAKEKYGYNEGPLRKVLVDDIKIYPPEAKF